MSGNWELKPDSAFELLIALDRTVAFANLFTRSAGTKAELLLLLAMRLILP
jgi:hypothetical protein